MTDASSTPICILAGGGSRRFGKDKALAQLNGKTLLAHVIDRVQAQSDGAIVINAGDPAPFSEFGLSIVSDGEWRGSGPLAGILTALQWARREGSDTVITLAVDLPFAPLDLIARLNAAGAPAVCASGDRWHPVNGIWRVEQSEALEAYLKSGKRSAHGWAEHCGAAIASFEERQGGADPFWNVNTPDEMAQAERMIEEARD